MSKPQAVAFAAVVAAVGAAVALVRRRRRQSMSLDDWRVVMETGRGGEADAYYVESKADPSVRFRGPDASNRGVHGALAPRKCWVEKVAAVPGAGDGRGGELRMPLAKFASLPAPRVVKTHAPSAIFLGTDVTTGALVPGLRIIYVTRDARDACVSAYYHAASPFKLGWPFAAWAKAWASGLFEHGTIWDHRRGWRARARESPDQVLWLRYEDVLADPEREIARVAAFVGVDATPELMHKVNALSNFDAMKQKAGKKAYFTARAARGRQGPLRRHAGAALAIEAREAASGGGLRGARLQETTTWDPSSICLVHAAYGDYVALSQERTLPLKRAYAEKHGYRVVARLEDTLEDLAAACPDAYSTTADDGFEYTMASAKYCSLEVARRSGCEWAFWTDADAVFAATDAAPTGPGRGCADAGFLGSCVNLGAFLLRVGSDEGRTSLRAMLDLSMPDIVASGFDSTYTLAGGHTIGDQCKGIHEATQDNDQCGLAYLLQERPALFDGSLCAGAHGESAWPVPNDCGDGDGAVDLQLLDTTLAASSCPLVVNCVRGLDPTRTRRRHRRRPRVLRHRGAREPRGGVGRGGGRGESRDGARGGRGGGRVPTLWRRPAGRRTRRRIRDGARGGGRGGVAPAAAPRGSPRPATTSRATTLRPAPRRSASGGDPASSAPTRPHGAAATGGACAAAGAEGWYVPCKWQMIAQMDAVCAGTFEAVPPAPRRRAPDDECQVHAFCDACRDDAGALAASCASYLAMNPQILDDGRDDWADRDASGQGRTRERNSQLQRLRAGAYDFVGRPDIFGELDYWCGAGAFGGARSRDCVFNLCTDGAPATPDAAVAATELPLSADLEAAGADCRAAPAIKFLLPAAAQRAPPAADRAQVDDARRHGVGDARAAQRGGDARAGAVRAAAQRVALRQRAARRWPERPRPGPAASAASATAPRDLGGGGGGGTAAPPSSSLSSPKRSADAAASGAGAFGAKPQPAAAAWRAGAGARRLAVAEGPGDEDDAAARPAEALRHGRADAAAVAVDERRRARRKARPARRGPEVRAAGAADPAEGAPAPKRTTAHA
ncbi:hypothetical protein JL721_4879 [Aureococcus anophagefferens]|nr:hypothetical protein JL721_4879 [Aureococcus anophagefferens]